MNMHFQAAAGAGVANDGDVLVKHAILKCN